MKKDTFKVLVKKGGVPYILEVNGYKITNDFVIYNMDEIEKYGLQNRLEYKWRIHYFGVNNTYFYIDGFKTLKIALDYFKVVKIRTYNYINAHPDYLIKQIELIYNAEKSNARNNTLKSVYNGQK